MVLLQINNDQCEIISAVIVCAALISYLLRYGFQGAILAHFVDHLANSFLTVDQEEAISREYEQVIIILDRVRLGLWLRNKEFLVLYVANGATDSNASIDSCHAVLHRD